MRLRATTTWPASRPIRRQLSPVVAYDQPWLGDLTGLDVGPPPVPHRHRHALARAPRRAGDRRRFLARARWRSPRDLARRRPASRRGSWSRSSTRCPTVLGPDFDLVYTGVGALNWLPDIAGWARVVAALLRPGGRLYVRDGHPMLTRSTTASTTTCSGSRCPYFEGQELHWFSDATYTDGPPVAHPGQYEWNHGLGEIVQSVIDAGLTVTALREHTECEWKGARAPGGGRRRQVPPGRGHRPPAADVHARRRRSPGPVAPIADGFANITGLYGPRWRGPRVTRPQPRAGREVNRGPRRPQPYGEPRGTTESTLRRGCPCGAFA